MLHDSDTTSSPRPSRRSRWLLLIAAGVLLALAAYYGTSPQQIDDSVAIEALMAIAPVHLQQSVPDVEVLDVEVRSGSSAKVQYIHDQLFDVVFIYRRGGQKRTITAPYGMKGGSWVTPTKVEMLSRDESALIIR